MSFGGLGRGRGIIRSPESDGSSNAGLGRSSLFNIDPATGMPNVDEVMNFSSVSADVFDQFFAIGGDFKAPEYAPCRTGFPVKKVKTEPDDKKPINLELGQEYVAEIVQREKEEAILCHQMRLRDLDPGSVNTLGTSATNLEGVSTVFGELNKPQTEEVKVALQPFFNQSRKRSTPKLKISDHRDKILKSVKINPVTIVEGSTGCGKTTQVPQYIADDCYQREQDFNIVVTQPRRIAAISVAKRVCAERDWPLGELVGYQVGRDKKAGETTKILYCTTGVLLQKLITVKKMDQFTHIIVDEVHERNEEVDLLLMVVRKFMWTHHANVRIVIMSATFDTQSLQEYFAIPNPGNVIHSLIKPVVVSITEKQHQTSLFYLNQLQTLCKSQSGKRFEFDFDPESPCLTWESVEVAYNLIKSFDDVEKNQTHQYGKGAVLVFLPGYSEINELKAKLDSDRYQGINWWVLPLHSTITAEEQQKVFETATRGSRKIILATNIAESSITVTDIEYVIDFCLTKNLVCDRDTNYPYLRLEWASKASCVQRQGRAGRVREGRCYRLVPNEFYERHLPDYPTPELLRIPLEHSVLKVKRLDLGRPKELLGLCVNPPNLFDINRAILRLKKVGGLTITINGVYDEEDGILTEIGKIMAILPIDVQLSRLILIGHALDCLEDCCMIASCLTMQSMFSRAYNREIQTFKSKMAWADRTFSDPLAYFNAFKYYRRYVQMGIFASNSKEARDWCERTFLQHKRIREVEDLYREIVARLEDNNIRIPVKPNDRRDEVLEELFLKISMCGAFYPNYFVRMELNVDDIRKDLHDKDPRTTVKISNLPQNEGVMYANQIRRLFQECSDQINLEFEDTHAWLTFSSDRNPLEEARRHQNYLAGVRLTEEKKEWRDTEVKTSVYVAMKLKQMGAPLRITLYKNEKKREILQHYIMARDARIDSSHLLRTNRFSVPATPSIAVPLPLLPGKGVRSVKIFITNVVDCGHFWAQYYNEDTKESIANMRDAVNLFASVETSEINKLTKGMVVLAPYKVSDERTEYCRARVDYVSDKYGIKLFYLDYGNSEIRRDKRGLKELPLQHPLTPSILKMPALAFECQLSEIKPSECITYDGSWNNAAREFFTESVRNQNDLEFKIYSVVNNVVRGELFIPSENRNINHELINNNFAEFSGETCQSRDDHEARLGVVGEGQSARLMRETLDAVEVDVSEPEATNVLSKDTIKIRGPFSPIEVSFQGLTRLNSNLKVGIERDSVNSVCLEPNPDESTNRLLVAANVSVGTGNNRMVARSTSLMPCIRGLASMMALIFSPCVEFRADWEGERYLGAVCGLGYDPQTKRSYDPEGDMELLFDVLFSHSDIGLINTIRLKFSDTLSSHERLLESAGPAFSKRQEGIRSLFETLLNKKRVKQVVKLNKRLDFTWGLISESQTEAPLDNFFEGIEHPFLPLLKLLRGIDAENYTRKVISNLEELSLIAKNNFSRRTHCMACDVVTYTLLDLHTHLISKSHVDKVMDVFPPAPERNELAEFDFD